MEKPFDRAGKSRLLFVGAKGFCQTVDFDDRHGRNVEGRKPESVERGNCQRVQLLFEVMDDLADVGVHFHAVFDEAAGVQHRAVIASAEGFADGVERAFGHLAREIHGDLARKGDVFRPAFAGHVGQADVKMFGDFFLDDFDADGKPAFFVKNFAQQAFDDFDGQFFAGERGVGSHADERAFEPADVGADAVGQKIHDFLRQRHAHDLRLLLENGQAHFDVRRLQIGDQPPFEPRDEAVFQPLNFAGRTVAGEHDLLVRLVQRVEGVEKFLLNAFLAGEELDVVNQQHVGLAVFLAELDELVVLDSVNVFVGELFGGEIGDARALFVADDVLADGVEQMRLAQADAAVKEERIVGFAGRLGDGQRGGIGKIVVVADDERFKGVFGIEMQFAAAGRAFVGGFGGFGFGRRWEPEPGAIGAAARARF